MNNLKIINIPLIDKVVINLLIATIFLDGLFIRLPDFDFYYYYIIFIFSVIFCLYKFGKLAFGPKSFIVFFGCFFLVSFITGLIFDTIGFLMYKQIAGICYTAIAYWGVFLLSKGNISYVAKVYMNLAFLEALYGVFGEAFHILGIGSFGLYLQNNNLIGSAKIMGTTAEPYFFALSLAPAVYVHLNNLASLKSISGLKNASIRGVITIIAFLLSGASSGFLAIFIMLLFLAYNKNLLNVKSLGLFLLPLFLYFTYFLFDVFSTKAVGFSDRVNHTFYAFASDETESVKAGKINGSTFALYSNFRIAVNSFKANPISGSGLGTHQLNYEKYFYKTFSAVSVRRFVYELNKQDANSTFLRLLSETGLAGLLPFLLFMIRNLTLRKDFRMMKPSSEFLILFNQGIFIMLLIRLMRTGNYVGNGFFFFFFCYWAINKFIKQQVLNQQQFTALNISNRISYSPITSGT